MSRETCEIVKTVVDDGSPTKIPESDGSGTAFEYDYGDNDPVTVLVGDNGYVVTARRGTY